MLLLPLVVGITYEFNRWVGRHIQDNALAKILTAPGMWMQNFTTNEPDDSMIEVCHPVFGAGAALGEGQGRLVKVCGPGHRAAALCPGGELYGPGAAGIATEKSGRGRNGTAAGEIGRTERTYGHYL